MLKVRINRSEWDVVENKKCKLGENLREGDYEGMLYNPKTKLLCCLGFVGLTCNIPKEELATHGEPSDIDILKQESDFFEEDIYERDPRWPIHLKNVEDNLIHFNDNQTLIGPEKESLIIEKGKLADIDFEFYGEYLKKEVNE